MKEANVPNDVYQQADVINKMTIEEAGKLPGMLKAFVPSRLYHVGWYAYTNTSTGERTLIIRAGM